MEYQSPEPADELLACFDEAGNAVESQTRKVVHEEPLRFWHGVVNVWLVNGKGELLVTKRSVNLSGNPGKWQTYLGGHVKGGKSFTEAALLEMDEEVGLSIDSEKLYLIEKGRNEPSKHFFESYVYRFDGSPRDLTFNDGEIVDAKWISFEEYNKSRAEHPRTVVQQLQTGTPRENQKLAIDISNIITFPK